MTHGSPAVPEPVGPLWLTAVQGRTVYMFVVDRPLKQESGP